MIKKLFALLLLVVPYVVVAQSAKKKERERDYSNHSTNQSWVVAKDATKDITSISYVTRRNADIVTFKKGDDADSLNMVVGLTSKKKGAQKTIALYSKNGARLVSNQSNRESPNLVILSYGDKLSSTIVSQDDGVSWSYNISRVPYRMGEVDGFLTDKKETNYYTFFSDVQGHLLASARTHSVIYEISSDNGGYSWSLPKVAVKHNLMSVSNPCVTMSKNSKYRYIMVMQGNDYIPYISYKSRIDDNWKYPVSMDAGFRGDMHKVLINNDKVYVLFRERDTSGESGKIVLWRGGLKEYVKQIKGDKRYVITSEQVDNSSLGYDDMDIVLSSSGEIIVLCSTKWEEGSPAYLKAIRIPFNDKKSNKTKNK